MIERRFDVGGEGIGGGRCGRGVVGEGREQ